MTRTTIKDMESDNDPGVSANGFYICDFCNKESDTAIEQELDQFACSQCDDKFAAEDRVDLVHLDTVSQLHQADRTRRLLIGAAVVAFIVIAWAVSR